MEAQTAGKRSVEDAAAIKAMTSQVNWALLGLLMERPGYGYQLIQQFERYYGDVLPLSSPSHIYTALNELKRRGLIEEIPGTSAIRSGTDRQPRVSYRTTVEGARSYQDRLLAQMWEDRRQSRLFVRQLAVFRRSPDVALAILDSYEKACLKEASHMPVTSGTGPRPASSSGLADRLISEESRLAMEGRLPWVEYARNEFKALEADRDDYIA